MKIRPLHDRILVKREDGKDAKKGRIVIPDRRRKNRRRARWSRSAPGKVTDEGKKIAARREGPRPHPVRKVLGLGGDGRGRGVPDLEGRGRARDHRVAEPDRQPDRAVRAGTAHREENPHAEAIAIQ